MELLLTFLFPTKQEQTAQRPAGWTHIFSVQQKKNLVQQCFKEAAGSNPEVNSYSQSQAERKCLHMWSHLEVNYEAEEV